jgi:hypothetical protein
MLLCKRLLTRAMSPMQHENVYLDKLEVRRRLHSKVPYALLALFIVAVNAVKYRQFFGGGIWLYRNKADRCSRYLHSSWGKQWGRHLIETKWAIFIIILLQSYVQLRVFLKYLPIPKWGFMYMYINAYEFSTSKPLKCVHRYVCMYVCMYVCFE